MGAASIHEGVRRTRFSSLLDRTEAKELTQEAAAQLLGINVRTFQRWAQRFAADEVLARQNGEQIRHQLAYR
jgi:CRP-like cAMP-binding protein